jgi:hypothetical protein
MKERYLTQSLALCVGFILLFGVIAVNHASLPASQNGTSLVADGVPLPLPDPPPPKSFMGSSSVMDGVPLPLPDPPPPKSIA